MYLTVWSDLRCGNANQNRTTLLCSSDLLVLDSSHWSATNLYGAQASLLRLARCEIGRLTIEFFAGACRAIAICSSGARNEKSRVEQLFHTAFVFCGAFNPLPRRS